MRSQKSSLASIAALIVGLVFLSIASHVRADAAPSWSLQDLNGKTINSSDFKGKMVILNFWATWCLPCRAEIPDFIEMAKQYQDKGLVIIGISLDSVQPSEVAAFVKKAGINYPIVMGNQDVAAAYGGIEAIPTTFVIDAKGKLSAIYGKVKPAEHIAEVLAGL